MPGRPVGHDGAPPVFAEARGSEVLDPKTGKVIREAIDSPQNVAVDRIEWLYHREIIDTAQRGAARMLQKDWERAEICTYASLQGGGGGKVNAKASLLSDRKLDAMARRNAARDYVGRLAWDMLELVVLQNAAVANAERALHLTKGSAIGVLKAALDTLARFYHLA